MDCSKYCSHDLEIDREDDQEMQERMKFFRPEEPKRKVSYYGTIHRTLGQEQQVKDVHFDMKSEEASLSPRESLSKSV